jgi:CheY-like chemotaxis protein
MSSRQSVVNGANKRTLTEWDREPALAAGASEYVTKPVDPERLLAIVYDWRRAQPSTVAGAGN